MTQTEHIPFVDLELQHRQVAEAVEAGWKQVIDRSAFVLGDEVSEFERAFASFCGTRHCIGVANGTDALEIALRALSIGPGDEVILPTNTFVATAFAVLRTGATPVLVDIDADTYLLDVEQVAELTTARTRAIMPVHLYGQIAPVELLEPIADRIGAAIVEDAAQAHGASRDGTKAGALGTIAGVSFYPGKNLGAYGDGGAVLTDSDDLALAARALGNHGSAVKYEHPTVGFNSRLDTLQAVVLSAKLEHLDSWNAARREAAARYDRLLDGVACVTRPSVLDRNVPVWHLYVVRVPDRDRVLRALSQAGISAGIHYPHPIHLLGAFRDSGYNDGDFPVAEASCRQLLSLPMYPGITPEQQERVVSALRSALD